MAIANYFYHSTTKKYIALFGSIFNKLSIVRNDQTGAEVQRMIVPISYGPYQKFLAKVVQDPELNRKAAITLPRMAFEISNWVYDGSRKIPSVKKLRSSTSTDPNLNSFQYAPTPYNLEFNLFIMAKYAEDGTQLLEQIIPFFKPEWTETVRLMPGTEAFDVPITLTSVSVEDIYEGDFETRRSLLWTLSFTMKAWYFGPVRERKIIKFIDERFFQEGKSLPNDQIIIKPGLTANGEPTSSDIETIPYSQIEIDDDWGIITIIQEYDE